MKNISLPIVHQEICDYFQVDYMYPFNRSKKKNVVYIRQLFHYISREVTNKNAVSFQCIGEYLSDITEPFNHATVINSCKKINGYLTYDKKVKKDVKEIIKKLNQCNLN